jgi:hypothetical protein
MTLIVVISVPASTAAIYMRASLSIPIVSAKVLYSHNQFRSQILVLQQDVWFLSSSWLFSIPSMFIQAMELNLRDHLIAPNVSPISSDEIQALQQLSTTASMSTNSLFKQCWITSISILNTVVGHRAEQLHNAATKTVHFSEETKIKYVQLFPEKGANQS